jgi:3',5'-cyclic AMP phosphodiesterase CpdA
METKDKLYIAVIVLALLALFYAGCNNTSLVDKINILETEKLGLSIDLKANETIGSVETATTVRVDTVVKTILKPIVERKDSFIIIPAQVDTLAIISKYFTMKYESYNYNDTAIALSAYWNVYKNDVKFDSIKYQVFRKTLTINNTVTIQQHNFRWGVGMMGGYNQRFVFGPHINLSTKKVNIGVGYDVMNKGMMVNLDANFYKR